MLALVALGSNLGPRQALLRQAQADLGRLEGTRLLRASPLCASPPEDASRDGGPYLNAAALLSSRLGPRDLLRALLELELRWGRRRSPGAS